MSAFLDRYHDLHHVGPIMDLINCPVCQDEFTEWLTFVDPDSPIMDRLEDQEV